MTYYQHAERLIRAAVETFVTAGLSNESAQVAALETLALIAAASGPKSLHRLIAENRTRLAAGHAIKRYEVPDFPADCDAYVAVPEHLLRQAHGWLVGAREAEERAVAQKLWDCLEGIDK